MDATQFGESKFVNAELVKASPTKKAVIVADPKPEETDYGVKLTIQVEIDKKAKTYRPNQDSVKNIISALGAETKLWIGKTLILNVLSVMGKDSVLAVVDREVKK